MIIYNRVNDTVVIGPMIIHLDNWESFFFILLVLEGEMYQLSHILTEEKSLMSSMMEMSLVSDKGQMYFYICIYIFVYMLLLTNF